MTKTQAVLLSLILTTTSFALSDKKLMIGGDTFSQHEDVAAAVGMLVRKKGDTFVSQTGFFFTPNLFLAARRYDDAELPTCENTEIFSGITDANRHEVVAQRTYPCKKVIQSNAAYGFTVVQIEGHHARYLPIAPSEKTLSIGEQVLATIGYTQEGRLVLSTGCRAKAGSCSFCRPTKEFPMNRQVWGELDCLYAKGSGGGPVFFQNAEGRVQAVGMLGPVANGEDGSALIQSLVTVIRFPAIQLRFGEDLTGREVR